MNNREVMQQALEFLDAEFGWSPGEAPRIDALRAALEEPLTDPTDPGHDVDVLREHVRHLERRVRELAPPQRKPLTDEELDRIDACIDEHTPLSEGKRLFARAIERAHGIGEQE